MSKLKDFKKHISEGYTFKKDSIIIGGAMLDGEPVQDLQVKIPLKTLNRHGLIAGATGTGKTKTLQILAEQMSLQGIPTVLMDIKGDLSGLAQPGETNDHIKWRSESIGIDYLPANLLVELMSISEEKGVRLRATVSEFGPTLMSKILSLNDTQRGLLTILFKYCDDMEIPLLDLKDLRKTLQFFTGEGKEEIQDEYGQISAASVNTIMRKVIELEQQGAEKFFGEKSFDVNDFIFTNSEGKGQISIIRLADIQNKPKLFSTFMLGLLAELYEFLPEVGDADKPKMCLFIDEAHLVFNEATDELLDQIEVIIKLIRSKGVGVFFCTQLPTDIPDEVLSQLGLKVQHALRAFTAKDRKSIKKTAENYPLSDYYETDEIITQLGIGEALVTSLNEKGIPTPLAATLLRAPVTRMDILSASEIDDLVKYSTLTDKYNEEIDRESAYEILGGKIKQAKEEDHQAEMKKKREIQQKEIAKQRALLDKQRAKERKEKERAQKKAEQARKKSKSTSRKTTTRKRRSSSSSSGSDILIKELTRGLFSILGMKK
ncbi:MAG: helicase HerA-like domain-containing protein [Crocinitomicaceae bacterium]